MHDAPPVTQQLCHLENTHNGTHLLNHDSAKTSDDLCLYLIKLETHISPHHKSQHSVCTQLFWVNQT